MRLTKLRLLAGAAAFGISMLAAGPAFSSTITNPSTNPFNVPLNAAGTGPAAFKIQATGFTGGQNVTAEICDGLSVNDPTWQIGADCDVAASTTAVISPPSGNITIDPTVNCTIAPRQPFSVCPGPFTSPYAIPVFDGASPGGLFNCLRPGEADPNNGLPSWGSSASPPFGGGSSPCQLRVSSNVSNPTTDQAFISLILPTPGAPVPESRYVVLLPFGALVLFGGGYLALRRRNSHSAPAAA